ncbi:MAG: hypothetical protein IPG60_02035 [Bacteroidetes bacterium]|nr:hypothetical protein [Bacteroidota bacterium]MBK7108278.1 hypothetical protein [Bacteroidota bacterium]MBK8486298.1 hypothetical protein [Bacteroidota bacterium]MBK8683080.1 hypothetical protein [Bacteroidota bacterium]MBP9189062.1 hypothetical protein [Chitinophagales bacterium]
MFKKTILGVIISLLLVACTGYGNRLDFNGGELYYTKAIDKEEANALGNYLVEQNFFSGDKISVQIDKVEEVYQFKMVSKEDAEANPENVTNAQSFAMSLSNEVFNGAPVNFYFCDSYFKTKLEIPFPIQ